MKRTDCFLCGDLADRGGRVELGHGLALAADIAPLAPGHMLLHTMEHVASFADCISASLQTCHAVIAALAEAPALAAEELLIFEHGTDGVEQAEAGCTDHAHIHILPVPRDDGRAPVTSSRRAVAAFPPEQKGPVIPFLELGKLRGSNYFWISDQDLLLRTIRPVAPERQFLRRTVAAALGRTAHYTWDLLDVAAAKDAIAKWRVSRSRPGGAG